LADVEIRPFHPSQTDELLKFFVKWTPNHPELGDRAVFDWQKANGYVAMHEGKKKRGRRNRIDGPRDIVYS
jgi:hypothetical protein